MKVAAKQKELNKQLRLLRKEWKAWRTGQAIADMGWWGLPWCEEGRRGRCRNVTCEGCVSVAYTRDRTAEIENKARALAAEPEPVRTQADQDPLFT